MGWGSDAPDMSGANEAAKAQAALARDQYNDFKTTFAPKILDQMQQQIDVGRNSYELAKKDQEFQTGLQKKYADRYFNTQVPLEDSLIADANSFDTVAEQNRQAAAATADVSQQFGLARGQLQRNMGRMGVNPSDPRFFSMNQRMGADEALAKANAVTKTREAARQMGFARKMDTAALGRGLPGFASSSGALGQGALGVGMQAGAMGLQGALAASGGANAAAATAGSNYAGAGQTYTNIAGIQQKASEANMEMLGTVAGAATKGMMMSDRRLKTDITRVGVTRHGIPIYRFRFKSGGGWHQGVMADEVARVIPAAVHRMPNGYDAVDYSMLGG